MSRQELRRAKERLTGGYDVLENRRESEEDRDIQHAIDRRERASPLVPPQQFLNERKPLMLTKPVREGRVRRYRTKPDGGMEEINPVDETTTAALDRIADAKYENEVAYFDLLREILEGQTPDAAQLGRLKACLANLTSTWSPICKTVPQSSPTKRNGPRRR